jgi:predicted NodU family carbamoyl transferase
LLNLNYEKKDVRASFLTAQLVIDLDKLKQLLAKHDKNLIKKHYLFSLLQSYQESWQRALASCQNEQQAAEINTAYQQLILRLVHQFKQQFISDFLARIAINN